MTHSQKITSLWCCKWKLLEITGVEEIKYSDNKPVAERKSPFVFLFWRDRKLPFETISAQHWKWNKRNPTILASFWANYETSMNHSTDSTYPHFHTLQYHPSVSELRNRHRYSRQCCWIRSFPPCFLNFSLTQWKRAMNLNCFQWMEFRLRGI